MSLSAKISIVIPMFNSEKYIESTLKSVLNQTYSNFEVIVVDDCSTDASVHVVNRVLDNRIKCFVMESNSGAPAAPRNFGIKKASGEYIAFLDSDDIWHPKKLEVQINAMQNHKAKFSSTEMFDFYNEDEINFDNLLTKSNFKLRTVSYSMLLKKNRIPTSTVIAKKDLLLDFPFNEDLSYRAVEDYDCWLKVHMKHGSSIKLLLPLLAYRKFDGISSSKSSMVKKVFMVLSNHKTLNGEGLGLSKYYYMITYSIWAVYLRVLKKKL